MKILCLNVCLFKKNNDKIEDFLSKHKYDIACFQEVTRSTEGKANSELVSYETINQYSELEKGFFAPMCVLDRFYTTNFHGHDLFDFNLEGNVEFGNLLRTNYEIVKGQNIFLQNHFTYVTNWDDWPEEEYRGIQVTDLKINDTKKLRVMNYHGIWSKNKVGNNKTLEACKKIKNIALEVDYPSVICGDFNLFPDTDSMKVFEDDFNNLMNIYNISTTRPKENELSDKKRNVVDYIITSKNLIINNLEVLDSDVSDHLPLVVDIDY